MDQEEEGDLLNRAFARDWKQPFEDPDISKLVPLWEERFGWACVVSRSEMWGELPIEVNAKIVGYLVETHWKCSQCPVYMRLHWCYCSDECEKIAASQNLILPPPKAFTLEEIQRLFDLYIIRQTEK